MPYSINESQLNTIFNDKGFEPVYIKIIVDKEKGTSRGFGYVQFENSEVANQVFYEL